MKPSSVLLTFVVLDLALLAGCTSTPPPSTSPNMSDGMHDDGNMGGGMDGGMSSGPGSMMGGSYDVPVFTVGDTWTEKSVVTGSGAQESTTVRTIKATETLTVGSNSYDTYRMETSVAGAITTQWMRVSDLATVKTSTEVQGMTITTMSDPPCALQWPFKVGMEFTSSCTVKTESQTQFGPFTQSTDKTDTYKGVAEESVTVPAGSFTALKFTVINTQGSSPVTTTQWYAEKPCSTVKSYQSNDGSETTIELQSYQCASG